MNIYTKNGSKVRYTGESGYDYDIEHANKYLEKGRIYTVNFADVGSFCTYVYLIEVPRQCFNSVLFKNIRKL